MSPTDSTLLPLPSWPQKGREGASGGIHQLQSRGGEGRTAVRALEWKLGRQTLYSLFLVDRRVQSVILLKENV